MNRRDIILTLATCLAALGPLPSTAQISVTGGVTFSRFGIGTPLSGQMTGDGDLYLRNDLELGGELYLDGLLYMVRDSTGPFSEDQTIYFADDAQRSNEYLRWDDSADAFVLTNELLLNGAIETFNGNTMRLRSFTEKMTFLLDRNATIDAGTFPHTFTWYNNFETDGSRAMQLTSTDSSIGDLTIAGSLTQNGFDLAEMFLMAEAAEPGQLVAVSDLRPDAVRPAVAGDGGRLLGVVAADPGIILGGGAFSLDSLRGQWGGEVAEEFQRLRTDLAAEIYAERPGLREEAMVLGSLAAFAAHAAAPAATEDVADARRPDDEPGARAPQPPTPLPGPAEEELREAYRGALARHETLVFDLSVERFLRDRFARVALAGRVPVRADAGFGAIEIGDPLTASPAPGVAMRARREGVVVGTALEALPAGAGTILVFVDRDWYAGEPRARLGELEAQLQELRARLAALEAAPSAPPLLAACHRGRQPSGSGPRRDSRHGAFPRPTATE